MEQNNSNNEKILVLIMGGTINADHLKTKDVEKNGLTMTHVEPYRDNKGRLPVQILIEDTAVPCLGLNLFEVVEIADCDSKSLEQHHYQKMFETLKEANRAMYSKVLVIVGTDLATEIGETTEKIARKLEAEATLPIILVTAMQELSRDMVDGSFNHEMPWKTDGMENFWDAIKVELANGIHLRAHNGQYYPPSQLKKNFDAKRFELKI